MTGLLFITVFILLIPAAVFSAILTVCPACGYTSIAAAYAVAAAGDTIDIQANCNESLTWDKAVNVTSSLQNITWNGAASTAATLTTNGTIGNTAWTISNITMDHSNATGGYTIYLYNNPGPNLTILNCALLRSSASLTNNCVIYADITWSLNSLKLTKCLVAGNNFEYGLYMSGGNIDPSYVLVNTIVKGFNGNMYSALFDGSTNVRQSIQMTNCTIYGNYYGYAYTGVMPNLGTTVKNTVFSNNTIDASCMNTGDYTYCAFGQGTGFGTGCQYGVVPGTEFVNAAAGDFHLDSTSVKCRNLGTNTGAPVDDFDNVARPQEGTVDIGAYEYLPPTPTPTSTVSPSFTRTNTPTGTSTRTPTATPTSTASPSGTRTNTATGSVTSTATQTITAIATSTPAVYAYIAPGQAVSGQDSFFTYHVNADGSGPITNVRIKIPAGAGVIGMPGSLIPGATVSFDGSDILVSYLAGWNIWSDPNFDTITFDCASTAGSQYFGSYLNGITDAAGQTPTGYSQYVNFVTPTQSFTPTITPTATITPTLPGTYTYTKTSTQTPPFTPTFTSTITLTLTPGASGITAVFSDTAPVEASNAEKNIKFFGLDLTNIGLVTANITALTITATDGAGGAINASAYFNNMIAVDGAGNTYTVVFGAGNKIFLNIASPVILAGLGTISLQFYADIKSSVSPGTVKMGVQSAADMAASVPVSGSFPEMTAGTALKITPANVNISFYDLMPSAVSVGQTDVYVMVFSVSNPGTIDNSPVSINALTLTAMDEASSIISASSAVSRLVIRDSYTVYLDTTVIPAGGKIYCSLPQAITVPADASRNFYCVVDIKGDTRSSADYLKMGLEAAPDISVSDMYSGAAVAANAYFPMESSAALIQNRAQELNVEHAPTMPQYVSTDQNNVEGMTLVLTDTGDTLTASIMVSRLYFHVQNPSGADITGPASSVLKSLEVTDMDGSSIKGTATNLGSSVIMINLTAPVIVPAASSVTISVRAGIAPAPGIPNAFMISLVSPDEIYAVDSNVFSKVKISSSTPFSKNSGVANIQGRVTGVTLNNFSALLPAAGVLKGQKGVQLFSFQAVDNDPALGAYANTLMYGISMTAYNKDEVSGIYSTIAPNTVFNNVFIVDSSGNTVGELAPIINPDMAVAFAKPVVLAPGSHDTFTVYADIQPGALYDNVRVDIDSASDISVKDANSLLEVNKTTIPGMPWQTGDAGIFTAPATDLKAWHNGSIVPTLVGMGQPDVKFMSISFYNDGFAGMANIQVTGITLTAMDEHSVTIPASSALETVYIKDQAGKVIFGTADVTSYTGAAPFYINNIAGLMVPASVTTTVYISADIPVTAVQRSIKLRLAADDVDRNSAGLYVTLTASNVLLDPFPMDSGLTTITALAFNFKVGHRDLMPVSVSEGQAGIQAMQLNFSSDNAAVPIKVTGLALAIKDADGVISPAGNYLSTLIIEDETGTTIGSAAAGPAGYMYVTMTPVQVTSASGRSIMILINIKNNAQGSFYIELETPAGVNTLPLSSVSPMTGDNFGMRTKAVSIKGIDLESSFHFFPNPFSPGREQCNIEYYLPAASEVTIKIYTMDGRLVRKLADRAVKGAGLHYEDGWDGQNGARQKVNSGVYLCVLKAINKTTGKETKLMQKIMAVR